MLFYVLWANILEPLINVKAQDEVSAFAIDIILFSEHMKHEKGVSHDEHGVLRRCAGFSLYRQNQTEEFKH